MKKLMFSIIQVLFLSPFLYGQAIDTVDSDLVLRGLPNNGVNGAQITIGGTPSFGYPEAGDIVLETTLGYGGYGEFIFKNASGDFAINPAFGEYCQFRTNRSSFLFSNHLTLGSETLYGLNNLYLGAADSSRIMIDGQSGNIGIRNTNPQYSLDVKGIIHANEIIVTEGPEADDVFYPGYSLLSISDLEHFIKEEKHLPGVPSAVEFKTKGYNLGEMDELLLRKIEELTLYIIELKKENEELKSQMKRSQ